MTFDDALRVVLLHEGGATVTDDPRDPGGLTKYGISQRAFPDLDIRALTEADAGAIYRARYWDAVKCDSLPASLRLVMFDMAVNMGVGKAATLLQKAVGVAQDGVIGPNTIRAAERLPDAVARLSAERALAYSGMRGFDVYGRGWLRRCFITALEAVK